MAGTPPSAPAASPLRPLARRLSLAGPADLARAAEAHGLSGSAAAAWADAAWAAHVALTGLDEPSARALLGEGPRFGVRVVAAGGGALLAAAEAGLRSLAARLASLGVAAGAALQGLPPPAGDAGRGGPPPLRLGRWLLPFGRKTYVMAIVNITPDSFSEDAAGVPDPDEAALRARSAVAAGADLVDLGAESSEARERGRADPEVEIARLLPVLERLRDLPAPLSVDTRHGRVARLALDRGAVLINDVEAGRDPDLLAAVAGAGAGLVVMHDRPGVGLKATYRDLVGEVAAFLQSSVDRAAAAGVAREQVVVDAGFGFAKTVHHDLELTRRLGELRSLGRPILHAPSRKRTIGRVLGFPETIPERLPGTAATVALGIAAGADIVRVHDVSEMARVARMADAIVRGAYGGEP
jgi:dihydropteroate synthase